MRFLSKPANIIHEQKRRGIRRVQQQQGGEEEGEEMPLLRQINFAEGLLFRVAVQREKDLQEKPAILRTRQHFHALPQSIQGQLQSAFLQMHQQRP